MRRWTLVVLVAAAALLTGCSGGSTDVTIPDSAVGKQLSWYMDAVNRTPVGDDELAQHLSADFLKEIPPKKFNDTAATLAGLKLDELSDVKQTSLVGVTSIPGQSYKTEISVDADGKINYLLLSPM
ncbi:Cpe/LpqF family protein [Thermopolyspora sp. NPDC052614]|uniref:Cpe/LpqF family protein n=1 Tax=Thermopolyspora sp. NPDC052614 TaxID=3155682 RepID=UPI00343ED0BA